MWLVFAEPDDRPALWAFAGLRRLGVHPIDIVTTDELVTAPRWRHEVGEEGVRSHVELHDGRVLDGGALRGVLNRIGEPRSPVEGDAADFARQEVRALLLSFLHGLPCPVVNPPAPSQLAGATFDLWSWRARAREAGLRIESGPIRGALNGPPSDGAELAHALVIGGECFGAKLSVADAQSLRRLAASVGVPVLHAWFRVAEDGLRFWDATPVGELRLGGAAGLERLRALLEASP